MREPYTLPDDQCERLKRSEMTAVRMLLAGLSTAGYARDDLQERLKAVPDGNGRMRRSIGLLKAVTDDLVGTISKAQCKQLYGTMKDFEMRLVPKLTPMSQNVIMTAEEVKELLECARWKSGTVLKTATAAGSVNCTSCWRRPRQWRITGPA